MHPNRAFAWNDEDAMLSFAAEQSFAHVFTSADDQLYAVHVPVLVAGGAIQFHLSRRNRAAEVLAGRKVLISISGRQAYQSANWYVSPNQVPTWHYEAVEIEGVATPVDQQTLAAMLDSLSNMHEQRVQPQRPWTRAKMTEGKFEAMLPAIAGFEVQPTAIRGNRKFNQHKQPEDLAATIAGQAEAGRADIVEAIAEVRSR